MEKQKTIAKEVSIEGLGLHTGNNSKVTFKPAPVGYGIKFIRTDLPQNIVISSNFSNVIGAIRGTTIGTDSVRIHTIEHILAVCSGLGIDNLEIRITNNEPPVLDGSSKMFAEILLDTGLIEQDADRNYLVLKDDIVYESGETKIIATPCDNLIIDCLITYKHPFIKTQQASFVITPETFLNEIAPSRTFCFDYEIEALKRKGLAKGGNLNNAIVIGINGIHNKDKKLIFQDEFVRHKILDLLGDLYLIGLPLKAHIKAVRCGHTHNINFAREIVNRASLNNTSKHKQKLNYICNLKGE